MRRLAVLLPLAIVCATTLAVGQASDAPLYRDPSKPIEARIRDLIGDFLKPVHVVYNTDTCAGGVADREACGICVTACPYDAISRDSENHLRMKIDHMACEGCGACVSACPTTSMRFTEPSPHDLYTRIAALLAPLRLRPDGERLVVLFHCGEQGRHALEEAGVPHRRRYR